MDLSALSDEDFKALQAGNLAGMSDAGFGVLLKYQQASKSPEEKRVQREQAAREMAKPTNGMSDADLFAAAAGKAVADTGLGIKQAFGGATRADVDERKRMDAPLMSTWAGRLGNVTGSIGVMAPSMFLPGSQTIAGAGVIGGVTGGLQPVGTDEERYKNALWGAGGGMAATAGANALSRVISPKPPKGVNALVDDGVTLTVGQRLGGPWKRIEDAMTSIPVTGDVIRNAQRRSFESFNDSVANRALKALDPSGGTTVPTGMSGRDAVAFVERKIGDAYDNALSGIKNVQGDSQFGAEVANLQAMVHSSPMPAEVQKQFDAILKSQIAGKFQGQNAMTAETFKDVESELGRMATKYRADPSADKQDLGNALLELQSSLRGLLERSAGPQYSEQVKAANAAWAQFKRMQRASTSLGAEDGVFNPEQYLNAVKAMDRSKDKGAFARGDALNQGIAEDAKRVMGRKVPDSGTPFRSAITNPLQGAVGAIPAGALNLWGLGPYSKSGQAMYQALLTSKRPAAAALTAEQIDALRPLLGLAGVSNALAYRASE